MKEYKQTNVKVARILRKNMTPWERKLWYEYLRNYPIRFQRQKAIGEYIADFYCAKAKLIIELDGSGHYEEKQILKDEKRTEELKRLDVKVIRISNIDVDKNIEGVCEYIDEVVKSSLPQTPTAPAPSTEGANRSQTFKK